jgi:GT2 family glycosyltransferase
MPPVSSPSVSLIVVNYETSPLTARLVTPLIGAIDELIVVDNASSDVEELEPLSRAGVNVVRLTENRGYGAGANEGRTHATGDVIVVANPDVTIDAAALRELASAARGVGVAGPRFVFPDGTLQRSAHRKEPLLATTVVELCPPAGGIARRIDAEWHPTLFRSRDHEHDLDASHLLGALMAVDARAWDDVDGFDEGFFLYREETDLCRRIASRGWQVRYVAAVLVEHIGGASSAPEPPLTARPVWLQSHYRYIRKHRGRVYAFVALVTGFVSTLVALADRTRRTYARRSFRWHVDRLVGRGASVVAPTQGRPRSP